MLRIRFKEELRDAVETNNFGSIEDADGTKYLGVEVTVHTPGDHTIDNFRPDMEMQVRFVAVSGTYKNQAVLSFLF